MVFQVEVGWNVKDYGAVIREGVASLAKTIQEQSRADIAASLQHGGRRSRGFSTKVRRVTGGYAVQEFVRPSYMKVWEYGGTSVGKPLLWIPVAPNRLKVRHYAGRLIRPKGKRVLMSTGGVRIRGVRGSGRGPEVKYVGVQSITNVKRFHLRQIAEQEAQKFINHMMAMAEQVRSQR